MAPLPRWGDSTGDRERCIATIDEWTAALTRSGIVAAFDTTTQVRLDGDQRASDALDILESFSGQRWDFRGGRERNLATVPAFTREQLTTLDEATATLGLDGTSPPSRGQYDAVVMTGGMVRAGIVKPRYLRELDDAGLEWGEGVFLGGFRPFAGDELELAPRLGVAGGNEFDAMATGMRQAFGLPEAADAISGNGRVDASGWRDLSWEAAGRTVRVVAAPSSVPGGRRANTADSYRFWAGRATGVRSVLVITTPVYVPYQGAVAVEILGVEFGLTVETVAVSASASDLGSDTQQFLPHHRLQELRSAVHGMRGLRHTLAAMQS